MRTKQLLVTGGANLCYFQLIFSEECTEAEGRVWHMNHFVCTKCECQLGGQRYIVREEKPFCMTCYNAIAHHYCAACCKELDANEPHITQVKPHCGIRMD